MKIEMIDLVEFFDDKNKELGGMGIGATGIITQNQMINRYNDYSNFNKCNIKGTGSHFDTEGSIMSDIFGYDRRLFLGYGYDQKLYSKLNLRQKRALGEMVVLKYINNSTGKYVLIYLPQTQETITEEQFEAIKYVGEKISEAGRKLRRPIKIMITDRKNKATEINSIRNYIIPFIESHIDDTYEQSIIDENIIAEEELGISGKRLWNIASIEKEENLNYWKIQYKVKKVKKMLTFKGF